jgi:hypothetical protein
MFITTYLNGVYYWSLPTCEIGLAGCGLTSSYVNCFAASVAKSIDDLKGIFTLVGNNSTISTTLSLLVLLM